MLSRCGALPRIFHQSATFHPGADDCPLVRYGCGGEALQIDLSTTIRGSGGSQHKALRVDNGDAAQKRVTLQTVGLLRFQFFRGVGSVRQIFCQGVQRELRAVENLAGVRFHHAG